MAKLALQAVSLERNNRSLLAGIDLSFSESETTLLLGANGSGKSVLLLSALGLFRPDSGTVTFDGDDVYHSDAALRRRTTIVFQKSDIQILGSSVRDDMEISLRSASVPRARWRDYIGETAELFGLAPFLEDHPATLSGGMRQRLALASAVIGKPSLVFLDEPLLELDYSGITFVLSVLRELAATGVGLVIATHNYKEFWDFTDRVIVIDAGAVVSDTSRDASIPHISEKNGLRPWR